MYSTSLIDLDAQAERLKEELARAEERLIHTRQLQAKILAGYCSAESISELEAYCRAAQSPAYRNLRRDEQFYQSTWLRAQARLLQMARYLHPARPAAIDKNPVIDGGLSKYSAPIRQVIGSTPGRNEPCRCGSGLKYKRCCGNPLSGVSRDPLRIVPALPPSSHSPPRAMG